MVTTQSKPRYQPVIAQYNRDKAMTDLFAAMYDLYDFVVRAGHLPEIGERRTKLLKNMSLQTAECAYFIRDKIEIENFCEEDAYCTLTASSI